MLDPELVKAAKEKMGPARMVYTVRVLDAEWEEENDFRRIGFDSQEVIEYLLFLLDADEQEVKKTFVLPETLLPDRCYLVEGFCRA